MNPNCHAPNCQEPADVEVILYDVYLELDDQGGDVFFERDHTCPFLCNQHMVENEQQASGTREPGGDIKYPFTNQNGARGFTIYRPLKSRR